MTRLFGILLLGLAAALPAKAATEPRIGLQLWSVRDAVADDFKGTLTQLAEMGFQGVEFAGDYGPFSEDPQGLKAFMDELGLACAGTHIRFEHLELGTLDETVNFHKTLGCPTLIVSMDQRAFTAEGIDWAITELNRVSIVLQGTGLAVGYHNHWQEFEAYGDATFWDALAGGTSPEVVLQLDVRHVAFAGEDPVEYLNRYPGRTYSSHFKAFVSEGAGGRTIIGEDSLDWPLLFETATSVGGTEWLILEQEEYPEGMSSMESSAASLSALQAVVNAP